MAKTKVSDVIVPSVFAPYALEKTAELSALVKAGIIGVDSEFDELSSGAGKTVDLPFWKDLSGDSEVLSDSADLTVDRIQSGQDTATVNNRGKAWGSNILARLLSGSDPQGQIADLVADYWQRDLQTITLKILDGLFDHTAGVLRTTHRLTVYSDVATGTITDAMRLTGDTFIDGLQKLGDANQKISALAIHSDTEALLKKRELIDFLPDSEGKFSIRMFQGRRVIIDDRCPKVAGVNTPAYTSYLFGDGALAAGFGTLPDEEAVEVTRNSLASDDILINRRRFILHPRGVRWVGNAAGASPTNAELATAANWGKVYTDKNIRVLAIRHNV